MRPEIETIIAECEPGGRRATPIAKAIELGLESPEAIFELARETIVRCPSGGTFLDAALSYLPAADWPSLVSIALDAIEAGNSKDAAVSVIAYASLQAPSALHPHLDRIYRLAPNATSYYAEYPWRESGTRHLSFLTDEARTAGSEQALYRVLTAMLETRDSTVLESAIRLAPSLGPTIGHRSADEAIRDLLPFVGFEADGTFLRRLTPPALFHLVLPATFRDPASPAWLDWNHPTWRLPADDHSRPIRFGGSAPGHCSLCGGQLHRLMDLDPMPEGLGVSGLRRLDLATCLSCIGYEAEVLFYAHDRDGTARSIGYEGERVAPQFPAEPLLEDEVRLATTPSRWRRQDWALSNGRENLHRLGGEPCWIQDADYPSCPQCGQRMTHLLQLDSELPTSEDGRWLWGSGGLAYVTWCDECNVSAARWQCT